MIYVPGGAAIDATRPVWVDRQGEVQPVGMPPRSVPESLSLSPDGRKLAIVIGDPNSDVWVQDLERGVLARLTSGGNNVRPVWTPDGKRVVFAKNTGGESARRFGCRPMAAASLSGCSRPIIAGALVSFSPDGQLLTFNSGHRTLVWISGCGR